MFLSFLNKLTEFRTKHQFKKNFLYQFVGQKTSSRQFESTHKESEIFSDVFRILHTHFVFRDTSVSAEFVLLTETETLVTRSPGEKTQLIS